MLKHFKKRYYQETQALCCQLSLLTKMSHFNWSEGIKTQKREYIISNLRDCKKPPVASTYPLCQSKSLRRMRKEFWSHLGAEPGGSNSHSNPLNRPYNTTHILASHSRHIVTQVVLKSKLEGNSQDRPKIVTICICFTSWTGTTRTYFKSRGQI